MAFQDPGLFRDPSLFPVCHFVTLISSSPRWSGRAWKQVLLLGRQHVLGKEMQPDEMQEASLAWNSQLSGRGTQHLQHGVGLC